MTNDIHNIIVADYKTIKLTLMYILTLKREDRSFFLKVQHIAFFN